MPTNLIYYQQKLNITAANFSLIAHEDAIVAEVYYVTEHNKPDRILKICASTREFLREVYFLTTLNKILPVAHIIAIIEPEEHCRGAILMTAFAGTPLKPNDVTKSIAHQMGIYLATLHQQKTTYFGNVFQSKLRTNDYKQYLQELFIIGLDECKEQFSKDFVNQIQLSFEQKLDSIKTVDGPCLTHRDYRPGNIMASQGAITGIIDFGTARSSFAEEDFCHFEHDWGIQITTSIKNAFLEGYATVRVIPEYQQIMLLLRINRSLDMIGFTLKKNIWQTSHKKLYEKNLIYLKTLVEKKE